MWFQEFKLVSKHLNFGHLIRCDSCKHKFSKIEHLKFHINNCYADVKDKSSTKFKSQCFNCRVEHIMYEGELNPGYQRKRKLDDR
jgi:hypothetical protein